MTMTTSKDLGDNKIVSNTTDVVGAGVDDQSLLTSISSYTGGPREQSTDAKSLKRMILCLGGFGTIVFLSFTLYAITVMLLHANHKREYYKQVQNQQQIQQQQQGNLKPILNTDVHNETTSTDEGGEGSQDGCLGDLFENLRKKQPTQAPTPVLSSSVPSYTQTEISITSIKSALPTMTPSDTPFNSPSMAPSFNITAETAEVTTFYAIGDVPYTDLQHLELVGQIQSIPSDAEFVIHVGDIRFPGKKTPCLRSEYSDVAATLSLSPVPVFIVMGDNDWNDCPNYNDGMKYWQEEFRDFHRKHWNHSLNVVNQPSRPDNFAFVQKQTLFVGLNIVGGSPINRTEWDERLTDEAEWTIALIKELLVKSYPDTPRVVIFGHANPKPHHANFFDRITDYIQSKLLNAVPVLYLCGDRHRWLHQPNYLDQPSFTRIMLTGKTIDPPLQVQVHANGKPYDQMAFQYNRMLPPGHPSLLRNGSNWQSSDDEYNEYNDDDVLGTDDLFTSASNTVSNHSDF